MKNHSKDSPERTQTVQHKGSFKKFLSHLKSSALFIIIFLLTVALAYRIDNNFRVAEMTVIGESKSYPFKGKDQYIGEKIWSVEIEDVQKYVKNANPYYRIIAIEKKYPDTISVEATRLIPVAYLTVGDGFFLLSREGLVLEKVREITDTQFPMITFYQNVPYNSFQRGDEIGFKEVEDSLYFLEVIQSAKRKVNSIDIAGFHMLGLYTEEGSFLFTSEKDIELQKYQLEQALRQFSAEGIKFDTLDLRFEKPILRF